MSLKIYHDKDIDPTKVQSKKVAVIGYGSQGHAHAQNLRDSGVEVVIGLHPERKSAAKAKQAGFEVLPPAAASQWADVIMLLLPDEVMADVFAKQIRAELNTEKVLAVAHGFNIHFGKIDIPEGIGVFMVAPKGPGHTVRRQYELGSGVPCLVAVQSDREAETLALALSYAAAIGGGRAGILQTSFKEETETDLFGEQAVLCGGLSHLIKAGFETLVEAGYSPEMAYFECLHEVKLITDLIFEGGIANMRYSVSNTAEYGDYVSGPRVIDASVKARMKDVLADIQSGKFANDWLNEYQNGAQFFETTRRQEAEHLIDSVGASLRSKIQFPQSERLVDPSKN